MSKQTKSRTFGLVYVYDVKTSEIVHTFRSLTGITNFEKKVMHKNMTIATSAQCKYPGEQDQTATVIFRGYTKHTGFTVYDSFKKKVLWASPLYEVVTNTFTQFIENNCKTLVTFVDPGPPSEMPSHIISNTKYPKEIFRKGIKNLFKEGLPHGRRFH